MAWLNSGTDPVASAMSAQQGQRTSLANGAISRGAGHMQAKEYDLAIRDFRLATAYQPDSADAYRLMGVTYSLMGKTDRAIDAYKKALKADPTFTQARGELATLYLKSERYTEAEKELKQLVHANASDSGALTSLGYVYMNTGRLDEAAAEFDKAARIAPRQASAHYNLGLISSKLGREDVAIRELQRAIDLDPGYLYAYSELAKAYQATGDTAQAQDQVHALFKINTSQSVTMAWQLVGELNTPEIFYMDVTRSTFNLMKGPRTALADLDPALATPGASKVMTVTFVFNKPMDPSSVQNVANWSITKSTGGRGGVYDNGVVLDATKEVHLSRIPISVSYDAENNRATVSFRVTQNATGDGVIDPSHWVFAFFGIDASGNPMDPTGDQWDGFSARSY